MTAKQNDIFTRALSKVRRQVELNVETSVIYESINLIQRASRRYGIEYEVDALAKYVLGSLEAEMRIKIKEYLNTKNQN